MRTFISYVTLLLPALILSSGGSVAAQTPLPPLPAKTAVAAPAPAPSGSTLSPLQQLAEANLLYQQAEQIINQEYARVSKELSAQMTGATAAQALALAKEIGQLQTDKKQNVAELKLQKEKVVKAISLNGPTVTRTPPQLAPVCGKPTPSNGMVILVSGSDAGKNWVKALEGKLGPFKRTQTTSLQGGATAGDRFKNVTALTTETVVEDGSGLLTSGNGASARAKQAILARWLLLTKRIVVVQAPAALTPADKAAAKAWGWRVLGDSDSIGSVFCPP